MTPAPRTVTSRLCALADQPASSCLHGAPNASGPSCPALCPQEEAHLYLSAGGCVGVLQGTGPCLVTRFPAPPCPGAAGGTGQSSCWCSVVACLRMRFIGPMVPGRTPGPGAGPCLQEQLPRASTLLAAHHPEGVTGPCPGPHAAAASWGHLWQVTRRAAELGLGVGHSPGAGRGAEAMRPAARSPG